MKKTHTLIVGGTKGIGRALVRILAEEKHVVSVIGMHSPSESDQKMPDVFYWTIDISDKERLTAVLADIIARNGRLNNLVFFQRYRGDGDDWSGELDVSITATKNIIEFLVDKFNEIIGGSIVLISSMADRLIAEEQPLSYHIAKAGIRQMARYYAFMLGQRNIRVNCVLPGIVMKDEAKDFYLNKNKKLHNLYKKITPLGRMGTSEDIANAVAFLCSQKASFITGQNLIVDGGVSLQWQESLARKLTRLGKLNVTRKKIKKNI